MNSKIARLIIEEVEINEVEEQVAISLNSNWKKNLLKYAGTGSPDFWGNLTIICEELRTARS